jgi:hypothetical protein
MRLPDFRRCYHIFVKKAAPYPKGEYIRSSFVIQKESLFITELWGKEISSE